MTILTMTLCSSLELQMPLKCFCVWQQAEQENKLKGKHVLNCDAPSTPPKPEVVENKVKSQTPLGYKTKLTKASKSHYLRSFWDLNLSLLWPTPDVSGFPGAQTAPDGFDSGAEEEAGVSSGEGGEGRSHRGHNHRYESVRRIQDNSLSNVPRIPSSVSSFLLNVPVERLQTDDLIFS